MRRYITIYYLLFVLIIMGAFASMAQNAYGLRICGVACVGFALAFLHEILFLPRAGDDVIRGWMINAELVFLSVIAIVFVCRNYAVELSFSEILLLFSLSGLLLLYSYHALLHVRKARNQMELFYPLIFYYGAVLLFVLSFLTSAVYPRATTILAVAAIVMISIFAVVALVFKRPVPDSDGMTIWSYLRGLKNKSSILLIASILVSGYSLLYSVGILPSFYYGTPKGYQDLVKLSAARTDNATKEKSREFIERYDAFVRKYSAP